MIDLEPFEKFSAKAHRAGEPLDVTLETAELMKESRNRSFVLQFAGSFMDILISEIKATRQYLDMERWRTEVAIEAGARVVGLQAGAMGHVTTNSEDRAKFLSLAGLEEQG